MIVYQEKRARTFAETLQEQLDKIYRQQTREKLKTLGPERLTVTLTDYLKSLSRDPVPSCTLILVK